MNLGPFFAGWMPLDDVDVAAMNLDKKFHWQGLALGVNGSTYFRGILFKVRPLEERMFG